MNVVIRHPARVMHPQFINEQLARGVHIFSVPNRASEIAPNYLVGVVIMWSSLQYRGTKQGIEYLPQMLAHEASLIVGGDSTGFTVLKSRFGLCNIKLATWQEVLDQLDPAKCKQ